MRPDEMPELHEIELDPYVGELVRVGAAHALFAIGDRVRTAITPHGDEPPPVGFVTGIMVTPGSFLYAVCWCGGANETRHYAMELIADEDGLA